MSLSDKIHFVGVGGSGMSALAQFHALGGGVATGSDRLLDRGAILELKRAFADLKISVFPQDGSGIDKATRRVIASAAIETGNPDLERAAALGVPVATRADALAEYVAERRTLAVAGTSGKSTVTAMIYEALSAAGLSPSLITGAPLASLKAKGLIGNAARAKSDLLVIEADESDGTLPKYRPEIGVLLNMGKDHKELSELMPLFESFLSKSARRVVNADAASLGGLRAGAVTFGFGSADVRGTDLELGPRSSRFLVEGIPFEIPLPGRYNAENALAAAAACREAGVGFAVCAAALAGYRGVARRFERVGESGGVEVIDDFAHNPDKVRAVLGAARLGAGRVLAVFQPHGFAPTRFLKDDFVEAFAASLGERDVLWLTDIYFAGGTAVKDITSDDIARPIRARGRDARYVPDREAIVGEVVRSARRGDVVLVLGARDPSLGDFARSILDALSGKND